MAKLQERFGLGLLAFLFAGLCAADRSNAAVIVRDSTSGKVICTDKIRLADGLVISVAFVVIPTDRPEATKLNGGLAALVLIDNDTAVEDFRLSERTITTLTSGKEHFSIFPPAVKNVGQGVRGLEFASLIAVDLLSFLQKNEIDTVTVQNTDYKFDARWTKQLKELVDEVGRQRNTTGVTVPVEKQVANKSPAKGGLTIVMPGSWAPTVGNGDVFTANGMDFKPDGVYTPKPEESQIGSNHDRLLKPVGDGNWAFQINVTAATPDAGGMIKKDTRFTWNGTSRSPRHPVSIYATGDFVGGSDTQVAIPPPSHPALPADWNRNDQQATEVVGLHASDWPLHDVHFHVGQNGTRFTFTRAKGNRYALVVDGKEETEDFEKIECARFSGDGQHVYYFGEKKGSNGLQWFLISDGVSRPVGGLDGDGPGWLFVDQSGSEQVFVCSQKLYKNQKVLAMGGKISDLTVSADFKHIAYSGITISPKRDIWQATFADGQMIYDGVLNSLVFSADGGRLFGYGPEYGRQFVVVDGRAQTKFFEVGPIALSPNSKRYAYYATADSGERFLVVDGQEHLTAKKDEELTRWLYFSADSKHLMTVRITKPRAYWSVYEIFHDDVAIGTFKVEKQDYIPAAHFAFSDDGRRVLYSEGANGAVILDGKRMTEIRDGSKIGTLCFWRDKPLVVAQDPNTGKVNVWIDGKRGRDFDGIVFPAWEPMPHTSTDRHHSDDGVSQMMFLSDRLPVQERFSYLVRDGESIKLVNEGGGIAPATVPSTNSRARLDADAGVTNANYPSPSRPALSAPGATAVSDHSQDQNAPMSPKTPAPVPPMKTDGPLVGPITPASPDPVVTNVATNPFLGRWNKKTMRGGERFTIEPGGKAVSVGGKVGTWSVKDKKLSIAWPNENQIYDAPVGDTMTGRTVPSSSQGHSIRLRSTRIVDSAKHP